MRPAIFESVRIRLGCVFRIGPQLTPLPGVRGPCQQAPGSRCKPFRWTASTTIWLEPRLLGEAHRPDVPGPSGADSVPRWAGRDRALSGQRSCAGHCQGSLALPVTGWRSGETRVLMEARALAAHEPAIAAAVRGGGHTHARAAGGPVRGRGPGRGVARWYRPGAGGPAVHRWPVRADGPVAPGARLVLLAGRSGRPCRRPRGRRVPAGD